MCPLVVLQVALKLPKAPPCHQEVLIMEVSTLSLLIAFLVVFSLLFFFCCEVP